MAHVIVVGAGQAGASCVARLRKDGFDGAITLIGAEPVPPYQRPPLSKAYLLGEMTGERLLLRPESYYAEQEIDLRLNTWVEAIDVAAQTVKIGDETLAYCDLVLSTGSAPRRLPSQVGGDLARVFTVRDLSDVDGMAPLFRIGARALIVGGGYIGLEAAAVAAKCGVHVTLVEMAERILQRVASRETSDYFRTLHRQHGVDLREGVGLKSLTGDTVVTGADLTDGTSLEIDFALVGIGIGPAVGLAMDAGLEIDNGIRTDALGRTSAPHVWAAGDCASFPHQGGRIRLESVPHAIDQAELVARNILGAGEEYLAKPWFWSDQYDVKLQIAGLNAGYTDVVVRTGDGATQSVWYYRGDQLIAVDAMNDPRAYMIGKRLIESGKTAPRDVVAEPGSNLKALLSA